MCLEEYWFEVHFIDISAMKGGEEVTIPELR